VYRRFDADGRMAGDVLTLESDAQDGEPLLVPVMRAGQRLDPPERLAVARERAAHNLARLPQHLRDLQSQPAYPVTVAQALHDLAAEVDRHA
jgi:nicotinate phosphoribosyltransferase